MIIIAEKEKSSNLVRQRIFDSTKALQQHQDNNSSSDYKTARGWRRGRRNGGGNAADYDKQKELVTQQTDNHNRGEGEMDATLRPVEDDEPMELLWLISNAKPHLADAGGQSFFDDEMEENSRQLNMSTVSQQQQQQHLEQDSTGKLMSSQRATAQGCSFSNRRRRSQSCSPSNSYNLPSPLSRRSTTEQQTLAASPGASELECAKLGRKAPSRSSDRQANYCFKNRKLLLLSCSFAIALAAIAATAALVEAAAEPQQQQTIFKQQQQHPQVTRSNDDNNNIRDHKQPWPDTNFESNQQSSSGRVLSEQQGEQNKRLVKKSSPLDHVSSADLPAEFRGSSDYDGDFNDDDSVTNGGGGLKSANQKVESPPIVAAPREQSKLAKLCQQTSSVLASVLPAPFGGHKRSILCQFFGQVPQDDILQQQQQRPGGKIQPPITMPSYHERDSIAVIQQPQLPPITIMTDGRHPIQLVVEQFQQQQQFQQQKQQFQQQQQQQLVARPLDPLYHPLPVALPLMSSGVQDLKKSASVIDYAYHQKLEPPASMRQHLKDSSSHPQSRETQTDKLPHKFNAPIGALSFMPLGSQMPSSPLMSTSGWRIFNLTLDATSPQPLAGSSTTQAPSAQIIAKNSSATSVTTTGSPSSATIALPAATSKPLNTTEQVNKIEVARQNSSTKANSSVAQTKAELAAGTGTKSISLLVRPKTMRPEQTDGGSSEKQLLVMGKPPGFNNNQQQHSEISQSTTTTTTRRTSTLGKRTDALKSTTKSMITQDQMAEDLSSPGVRTIEVIAQQSSGLSPVTESTKRKHQSTTTTTTQMPPPSPGQSDAKVVLINDSNQNQKREELVIASINNLTRIAFGNHLRDTVKVINKLIDQQAELFSVKNKPSPSAATNKDHMLSAESKVVSATFVDSKASVGSKTMIKSSTSSRGDGKENSIYIPATTKSSRQKQISALGATPQQQQQQIKPTKKPKKQTRAEQQTVAASVATGSQATRASSTHSPPTGSTSPKKMASFNFQKLSTPSAAIATSNELRIPRITNSESRRLSSHASSRSLALDLARKTTEPAGPDYIAPMGDIRRDKPLGQANMISPKHGARKFSSATTTTISGTIKPITSSSFRWRPPSSPASGATTYPWLQPDKLPFDNVVKRPAVSRDSHKAQRLEMIKMKEEEPLRTTMSAKQALVLNRIDNTVQPVKLDSLTTLKMSLTTQPTPSTSTPAASSPPPITSSFHSRWIPSSTLTLAPSASSSTSTTVPVTTTTPAQAMTTSPQPTTTAFSNTLEPFSSTDLRSTIKETSLSDLNEARASDSISKYTTHWNEANELLATTSRRFFQQPLPQTAHTGEFFSAETISVWPERYQTMIGQALDGGGGSRTTPSFETTRRNGETYETNNPLARHRYDAGADTMRTTPAFQFANMSSITILPPNHKLTTTTTNDMEQQTNTVTLNLPQTQTTAAAGLQDTTMERQSRQTLLPAPGVAYTLVGPFSEPATLTPENGVEIPSDDELHSTVGVKKLKLKFPNSLEDLLLPGDPKIRPNGRINSASSLRPPYLGPVVAEIKQQASSPSSAVDYDLQSISDHQVARKLHELLIPSTRTFVGAQNPLNQQRFNLSALKYLAQNVLGSSPLAALHYNNSLGGWPENYFINQQHGDNNSNSTQQQRLLDMLGSSLPANYYEMLLNEPSSSNVTAASNRNTTETGGRSIIGRAGNLLNDLKQLEQKKAAAILAAIRYQVPSPLVRPWDSASDSMSNLSQMRDRLDESGDDYIRDSLLFAQASRAAIKAAMAQQRVIPRNELEARLNGTSKHFTIGGDEISASLSERRSDSHQEDPLAYLVDKDELVAANGSRHDDDDASDGDSGDDTSEADYSLSNASPLTNYTTNSTSLGNKFSRGRNFTKILIDKLLGSALTRSNLNRTLLTGHGEQNKSSTIIDLDPMVVDDSQSSPPKPLQQDTVSAGGSDQYPKYIRFMDYRTWGGGSRQMAASESQAKSSTHIHRQHLPSSAIAAKLRENMARFRTTTDSSDIMLSDGEVKKMDKINRDQSRGVGAAAGTPAQSDEPSIKFDCTGKLSGFHPDTETACQTFYHCSSTGHLLTFNCPQQTRFDEKSLKCGPWFEVPCDLGRSKQQKRLGVV